MNLRELTGLELDTVEQASAYYTAHKPVGGPDFSEEILPLLRACTAERTWEEIVREREKADEANRRALDPTCAVYGPNKFYVGDEQQHLMDEACARALESCDAPTVAAGNVFLRAAKLVALLRLVPVHHETNSADFLWARLRVLFSGAGFHLWPSIVDAVASQYPNCPWLTTETKEEWKQHLIEAHQHCGWPVQLGHMRWADACRAVTGDDGWQAWHGVVALMHLLKHIRYDAATHTLVVLYNGTATHISLRPDANTIDGLQLNRLMKSLGGSSKSDNPLQAAFGGMLQRVNVHHFIQLLPLSSLTPDILCGPWSTLTPDPANDGFFQFGLALDGVWLARGGKIRAERTHDSLISEYKWNIINPLTYGQQRQEFESALPKTYAPILPVDYFAEAFPNFARACDHFPPELFDAAAVLFDTPLVANLLRPWIPELRHEFPLVAFLPVGATADSTTNQGKTWAAEVYGKTYATGIEATKLKEGDSAPDSRAAMDSLTRFGTVVLDEFYMPESKSHILCRDNIQALCTGRSILAGRVYENSGSARLSYSMTLSAKALASSPDIINRSIFWFLDSLTEDERANALNLQKITSGELSLTMRLGAWALIEKYHIIDELKKAPKASSPNWRFGCHRALAEILYRIRQQMVPDPSPLQARQAIDDALKVMREKHHQHTMDADDAGLLTMLAEGKNCMLTLRAVFDNLGMQDVQHIADWMEEHGRENHVGQQWGNCKTLLEGRLHVAGLTGRPLNALLPMLTGGALSSSDRMVSQLLAEDVRRMVPSGASWVLPAHLGLAGWRLMRGQDRSGTPTLRLVLDKAEKK